MTHDDPALWAEYSRIAEQADALYKKASNLANGRELPPSLKVKGCLLAYHFRQAFNEAKMIAGDRPEGAAEPSDAVRQRHA